MLPALLIFVLSLFVFYCIRFMVRHGEDIPAYFFLGFYLYTVFAQIGYVYYPELSKRLAYYGEEAFYSYWTFIFLSFVSAFVFYLLINFNLARRPPTYWVSHSVYPKSALFYLLSMVMFAFCAIFFYRNRNMFGWGSGTPMGSTYFVIVFRYFTISIFIVYVLLRQSFSKFKLLLLILYVSLFLRVALAAGNRTNILALFVAVGFYELSPLIVSLRKHRSKLLIIGIASIVLFNALFALLELRNFTNDISLSDLLEHESVRENRPLAEKVLRQDYYAPSHTLFVAMDKNFVHPMEVIKSNSANFLIGLQQPYLTEILVGMATGESQERGVGWASYLFTAGYCFMGMLGFLYNGLIWNLLLRLILFFSRSNNPLYNRFFYALTAYYVLIWVRTQSCIMAQSLWFTYLPTLFLFSLAMNGRIRVRSRVLH